MLLLTALLPRIKLSSGTSPTEGTTGTYNILLDKPAPVGGLTIHFNTQGSIATLGVDYNLTAGDNLTAVTVDSFTIAEGATSATLNVAVITDALADANETVSLNLTEGADYSIVNTLSFAPKVNYAAGTHPQAVSVGDLNGDGKTDMVVANKDSGTISVYLRNADNTDFDKQTDLKTSLNATFVSVADFNNDGKADLVVSDGKSNLISVYLRNATNTGFKTKVDYATGAKPQSVTVGDFDGDGKVNDIAVANKDGNTVSVFLRNATNTDFDKQTDLFMGDGSTSKSTPEAINVGDFNGDGKTDIVVTNKDANRVSVYLRSADNTGFEARADYAVGSKPDSVSVGDFNNDGQMDLAVANKYGNSVSVLLRNADNTGFDNQVVLKTGAGSSPESLTVGDFNNDGKADIAVANAKNYTVSVYLRNADNTGFNAKVDYATGLNPRSVTVGDFNGDGKIDLAVANKYGNNVSVLLNTSTANATLTIADAVASTDQAKLGTFSADKSSFTTNLSTLLPTASTGLAYITNALSPMATALFGSENFSVAGLAVTTANGTTSVSGVLNNGSVLKFTVGSTLLAADYSMPNGINFGTIFPTVPIVKDFVFTDLQFVLTNETLSVNNSTLGQISVNKGFNFIGTIDFSQTNDNVSSLLNTNLGIHTLAVQMNVDPGTGLALTAAITSNITLFTIGDFSATLTGAELDLNVDSSSATTVALSGDISLAGYDATRADEPALLLHAAVALQDKTLSLNAALAAGSVWTNPFGLAGTALSGLTASVTYTYGTAAVAVTDTTPAVDAIPASYTVDFAATLAVDEASAQGVSSVLGNIGLNSFDVHLTKDATGTSLTAAITNSNITLFSIGDFKASMTQANLNLQLDANSKFSSGKLSGDISLTGYDSFRTDETALTLNADVSLQDKTLSINAALAAGSVWTNPFGLTGTALSGLTASVTYTYGTAAVAATDTTTAVDAIPSSYTVDFAATLEWVDGATTDGVSGVLYNTGFRSVSAHLVKDSTGTTLTGTTTSQIALFNIGEVNATLTSVNLNLTYGSDSNFSGNVVGNLSLSNYDPTQTGEAALSFTASLSYQNSTVSLSANLDTSKGSWTNAFGLNGVSLSALTLNATATTSPFAFNSLSFDGSMSFTTATGGFAGFMKNTLGVNDVSVHVVSDSTSGTNTTTLSGAVTANKALLTLGDTTATLTQANLYLSKTGTSYAAAVSGTVSLSNYDPTQTGEAALSFTASLSYQNSTVSLSANLDTSKGSWTNAFGLNGVSLSALTLNASATTSPAFAFNSLTFDGSMSFSAATGGFAGFMKNTLGVNDVTVHVVSDSTSGTNTTTLSGAVTASKALLTLGDTTATLTQANLYLSKTGTSYAAAVSGTVSLSNYDPTQTGEAALIFTASLTYQNSSVSLSANLDTSKGSWINPFGLNGVSLSALTLNASATTSPFAFNSLSFDGSMSFTTATGGFAGFMKNTLGVNDVTVHVVSDSTSGTNTTTLSGTVNASKNLLTINDFTATLTQANLYLSKTGTSYAAAMSGTITLHNYDPILTNESDLTVTASISYQNSTTSIAATLDTTKGGWINPFGLTGTQINGLTLAVSYTSSSPASYTVSFDGSLTWDNTVSNALFKFVNDSLGIQSLAVKVNTDSTTQTTSVSGSAATNIKLISVGDFTATITQVGVKLSKDNTTGYAFALASNIALTGYDPTQNTEPVLTLLGSIGYASTGGGAVLLHVGLDPASKVWTNPFGLTGTYLKTLNLDMSGTFKPPSVKVHLEGELDFDKSLLPADGATRFMNNIGIQSLYAAMDIDTASKAMSLSAGVTGNLVIIGADKYASDGSQDSLQQGFKMTLTSASIALGVSFGTSSQVSLTLSGTMVLHDYDSTQLVEPDINISAALSLALSFGTNTSFSISVALDVNFGTTGWQNPYHLTGITLYNAHLEISMTVAPVIALSKLVVSAHAQLGGADITLAFAYSLNPADFAFYLDIGDNGKLSSTAMINVLVGAVSGATGVSQSTQDMITTVTGLLPVVQLRQIDMDNADHDNNIYTGTESLIKFVPFHTLVAGAVTVEQGISLGGELSYGTASNQIAVRLGFMISDQGFAAAVGVGVKFSLLGIDFAFNVDVSIVYSVDTQEVTLAFNTSLGDFEFSLDIAGLTSFFQDVSGWIVTQIEDAAGAAFDWAGKTASEVKNGWSAILSAAPVYYEGTSGGDVKYGDSGADFLFGYAGDDTLSGSYGSDFVSSKDAIDGGAGNDLLFGDKKSDGTFHNGGPDSIFGGDGNDTIEGNMGNDTLQGGNDNDLIYGLGNFSSDNYFNSDTFSDDDSIDGGLGNDTVYGGAKNDTLAGGGGDDLLYGDGNRQGSSYAGLSSYGATGNGLLSYTATGVAFSLVYNDGTTWTTSIADGNDSISGGAGNDTLIGGGGVDTLVGGTGDDAYYADDSDTVTESTNSGNDTVYISSQPITGLYLLPSNVENLVISSGSSINYHGNSSNNVITHFAGGLDTLTGEAGDDVYYLSFGDTVSELPAQGTDTVYSSNNYTLPDNVENLTLLGNTHSGAQAFINTSTWGEVIQTVDLLALGYSTSYLDSAPVINVGEFVKGAGKYNLVVSLLDANKNLISLTDATGAAITNSSNKYDTGQQTTPSNWTNIDYSFSGYGVGVRYISFKAGAESGATFDDAYVNFAKSPTAQSVYNVLTNPDAETADFTGWTVNSGTGWSASPSISNPLKGTGNALNNILIGNTGKDTLTGLAGDDTYYVNSSTTSVVEAASAGTDTLYISSNLVSSYTLPTNVENLVLTGTAASSVTGNAANNMMTANANNTSATGGAGNDTIYGGAGNDTLDGGTDLDSLVGGLGNDVYFIDNAADVVVEAANAGTDTINSSVSYTLPDNVEVLNLSTSHWLTVSGTGNSSNNILTGNGYNNTLTGLGGDDTYYVNSSNTTLVEAVGGGTDTVNSSVNFILSSNVENLNLTGTTAITGTGNELANVLTGNNAASTLSGLAGDDTYILNNSNNVIVEAANGGTDTVNLTLNSSATYSLANNVENLNVTATGGESWTKLVKVNGTGNALNNVLTANGAINYYDTAAVGNVIKLSGLAGDDTYIINDQFTVVSEDANNGTDIVNSSVSYALPTNVENLTLTGTANINATGNAQNNVLTGNTGNNTFSSGGGSDSLYGGLGDDTYNLVDLSSTVFEYFNDGIDTVNSTVSYVLPDNVENLTLTGAANINGTGNALDNVLTGTTGANVLSGLAGNDTYIVDNTSDTVVEAVSAGTDTVKSSVDFTLSANVENLTLIGTANINGTGNTLDNVLTGTTGANVLTGLAGNDTYIIDNTGDTVVEAANGGIDTVNSSVNFTLSDNVENLVLTGSSNINGTGNTLNNILTGNTGANALNGGAGNDTIYGGNSNDTLDGSTGADSLVGGSGSDTYYVDNTGDTVIEDSSLFSLFDVDTVNSSINYTLGNTIENLTLTGTLAINGTGNSSDNVLTGNSAANSLNGGDGNDTLYGGDGNDIISGGNGNDVIYDGAGNDIINISGGGFESNRIGSDGELVYSGLGLDTFVFSNITSLTVGRWRDTIYNFGTDDKIDVSAIDADETKAGNQAFTSATLEGKGNDVYLTFNINTGFADFGVDFEIHIIGGNIQALPSIIL